VKIGLTDYFCNVCGAEIPAGEENHEFRTGLLPEKGHCHSECLTQRNAVVGQYEETVKVLSALLDPGIESVQKSRQAGHIEARRTGTLKRVPKRGADEPLALVAPLVPEPVVKKRRAAPKPKKVKRGA